MVQVVFNPETSPQAYKVAEQLRPEWVVQIKGTVQRRPPGTENPEMATGMVEVAAQDAAVLNSSLTPPFYITDDVEAGTRLLGDSVPASSQRPGLAGSHGVRYGVRRSQSLRKYPGPPG